MELQEGLLGFALVLEGGVGFRPAGLLRIGEQNIATQQQSVVLHACI